MHFDQRTQRALREFGLSTAEIREVSEAVVEATAEEAAAVERPNSRSARCVRWSKCIPGVRGGGPKASRLAVTTVRTLP